MKFALYQQPKEQGNIPQSPIQHAANCQAYYMGTNGQLPCNCGAEKQPKEQPSTDNPNNITRLPVNMIQPNLYSQPLDEEIEKTHDDWVYDHENITCAGTLEKAIAQAQLLKVQPELAKLQARIKELEHNYYIDLAEAKADAYKEIGDNMISRSIAGFEALPKGKESEFYKGYWQAYKDKGDELKSFKSHEGE
jgi:hypothetical protein